MNAKQWVSDAIAGLTPPSIPTPFKAVVSARFVGRMKAIATIQLFNDTCGIIQIAEEPLGLKSFQWLALPAAFFWNEDRWVMGGM